MKGRAAFVLVISLLFFPAAWATAQDETEKGYKKPAGYASDLAQDETEKGADKPAGYASDLASKDKSDNITIPAGMELRKIGSLNLVVPKGAQMRWDRSQWIMEGPEDFGARSISEINARLDGIEKEQKRLKKSIEELKKGLKKPQEESKAPPA